MLSLGVVCLGAAILLSIRLHIEAAQPSPVSVAPVLASATGLNIGQIVQMTSGGPWLTIVSTAVGTPPTATATWYEWSSGKFETVGPLPQNCFRPVTPVEVSDNAAISQ